MGTLGEEGMRDPGKQEEKSVQREAKDRMVFHPCQSRLDKRGRWNWASSRYQSRPRAVGGYNHHLESGKATIKQDSINLLVHEILDIVNQVKFDAVLATNIRHGFLFFLLTRRVVLGHPHSCNLGTKLVGSIVLDNSAQDAIKSTNTDNKVAAQILKILLQVPERLCDEFCAQRAALPAVREVISGGRVRAQLAIFDETRNFDLIRRQDIDWQQVRETVLGGG